MHVMLDRLLNEPPGNQERNPIDEKTLRGALFLSNYPTIGKVKKLWNMSVSEGLNWSRASVS